MSTEISKDVIQAEALEAVKPYRRAGVAGSVGIGKTFLGLKHMASKLNECSKFLVVAPKLSVFEEWKSQAVERGLSSLLDHITFSTYLSLNKQDIDYDVVYLDECHNLLPTHEDFLKKYQGEILGLTGTPPRYTKSKKGKLVEQYCPIVYSYKTDIAVEQGLLNNYRIYVHTLELDKRHNVAVKTKSGKAWMSSEEKIYNFWTEKYDNEVNPLQRQKISIMRMKALMSFKSKTNKAHEIIRTLTNKCLVFANTKEQAEELAPHQYYSGNALNKENLEKFKKGDINLLSTVLQLAEGVNIPNLKESIILHAYGNERKSKQRIGRCLRLSPTETATIHVLCYANTVDVKWVGSSLEEFDPEKIVWL